MTSLISSLPPEASYFSLEFFPPKTQAGFTNLQGRLGRMIAGLRPLFVNVTWGAGGSTSSKSLELAEVVQRQMGVPTVLHLTCTNMKKKTLDEALDVCRELGVRNILALRGDPPREEYKEEDGEADKEEEFEWAIDLVRYIKETHGDYFCIGVAGYPEGHADENLSGQSVQHDLPFLADKVEAGADFIMTQLTYDINAYTRYERFIRDYEKEGKKPFADTIIIPGIMPIQSYQIAKRITKLSHAKLPADVAEKIEAVKGDDDAVKRVGVDIVSSLIDSIKELPQQKIRPRGFNLFTLNLERVAKLVLEKCDLIPPVREITPQESSDSDEAVDDKPLQNGDAHHPPPPRFSRRRASSVNAQPHNRVILESKSRSPVAATNGVRAKHEAPEKGTGIPASQLTRKQNLMVSEGQGSMGREATWDDYPNGRWGAANSPAYGEIDGYGTSLKCGPATARRLWGHPKSEDDITNLFEKHLLGDVDALPWSDDIDVDGTAAPGPGALRAETQVIRDELLALIEKRAYWTIASQPAVDGVKSDHATFGWGPRGEGFVFQKAFVEFFCSKDHWEENLRPKLLNIPTEDLSWMKTDARSVFESSDTVNRRRRDSKRVSSTQQPGKGGINAVTWGVFRGKEIVTPTIIEAESFIAWAEESYLIWAEWRRCFPRGCEEEKFLNKMRDGSVLVNIVSHRYIGEDKGVLWKTLLDD